MRDLDSVHVSYKACIRRDKVSMNLVVWIKDKLLGWPLGQGPERSSAWISFVQWIDVEQLQNVLIKQLLEFIACHSNTAIEICGEAFSVFDCFLDPFSFCETVEFDLRDASLLQLVKVLGV